MFEEDLIELWGRESVQKDGETVEFSTSFVLSSEAKFKTATKIMT